jgi:formate dehydrogenase major subunit
VILLWGSERPRDAPDLLPPPASRACTTGARLFVVDPGRTPSAQWADRWLGLDVGSDIALSNTMAREIIHAGLANRTVHRNATEGFDEYAGLRRAVHAREGERLTGVPAR